MQRVNTLKKYIVLGITTLLLIILVLMIPNVLMITLPQVKVTSMKTDTYCDQAYASGSIQEKDKTDVTSDFPLVVKKAYVSSGDHVSAGDTLFEVDKEKTQKYLLNLASEYASSASSTASLIVTLLQVVGENSSEQLMTMLPEKITAAKSGYITSVNASQDTLIFPESPLATLSDSTDLVAVLSVAESDAAEIQPDQSVILTGITAGGKAESYGKVTNISSSAHKQLSGTSMESVVDVTVAISQDNSSFKPGYTVNAQIELSAPKQVNLLPYDAVGQDEDGNEYVYVYENSMAQKRIVKSGVETPNGLEIVSGIYPSDSVLFNASALSGNGGYISVQGRVS